MEDFVIIYKRPDYPINLSVTIRAYDLEDAKKRFNNSPIKMGELVEIKAIL